MPYCCQCGTQVGANDRFCAKCGAQQASGAGGTAAAAITDVFSGINNRTAETLCYIPMVGWIAAIVVLASQRFRHETDVRFHAFQGLYLFVAWLIVDWVISPALAIADGSFGLHHLVRDGLQLLIFAAWILMLVKVSHGEHYRLPILGELADRSVCEQRS